MPCWPPSTLPITMKSAVIAAISTAVFRRLNMVCPRRRRLSASREIGGAAAKFNCPLRRRAGARTRCRRAASAAQEHLGGHASAAGALQLGQRAARPRRRRRRCASRSTASTVPGAPPPARASAAPARDRLARDDAARSRGGVERAQAALDRRRRRAPVDRRLGLGRSCARRSLPLRAAVGWRAAPASASRAPRRSAGRRASASRSCSAPACRRRRSRRARPAAWRRCRGRRPSA